MKTRKWLEYSDPLFFTFTSSSHALQLRFNLLKVKSITIKSYLMFQKYSIVWYIWSSIVIFTGWFTKIIISFTKIIIINFTGRFTKIIIIIFTGTFT